MELKSITMDQLETIRAGHAVIIVSDGKMKLGELPQYGTIQITCHENKVKRVKKEQETQF